MDQTIKDRYSKLRGEPIPDYAEKIPDKTLVTLLDYIEFGCDPGGFMRAFSNRRPGRQGKSGGHFRFWTETVTFVIAKITPAFLVTADGRRFGKATLSDLHLLEA